MTLQKVTDGILMSFSFVLLVTGFGGIAFGQSPVDDVAIKGYDTVAYFTAGKALKGNKSFTFQWHNMTWYFLTKDNRDLFANGLECPGPGVEALTLARIALDPALRHQIEVGPNRLRTHIAAPDAAGHGVH